MSGVFFDTGKVQEFVSEGSFEGLAKYNWGLLATIGAGGAITVSNASNEYELAGKAQTFTIATPTMFGGELQWSYNSRGEFIYSAQLSIGKSWGGGIATFQSKSSPVQWFIPAKMKQ